MIAKTRGLVLHYMPFKESSIITRVFTEDFGYRSFIVNGVRSAKSRQRIGNFQPLNLLELVIYHKEGKDLNRISEFKSYMAWHQESIQKQSVLLFLAEVLDKLLRNEHAEDKVLFATISDALKSFQSTDEIGNFHLWFLLKLLPLMGLAHSSVDELFEYAGEYQEEPLAAYLDELEQPNWQLTPPANGMIRNKALTVLMKYFKAHVPNFDEVQSLKVLQRVFSS